MWKTFLCIGSMRIQTFVVRWISRKRPANTATKNIATMRSPSEAFRSTDRRAQRAMTIGANNVTNTIAPNLRVTLSYTGFSPLVSISMALSPPHRLSLPLIDERVDRVRPITLALHFKPRSPTASRVDVLLIPLGLNLVDKQAFDILQ